jgi:hypothetical protein
MKALTFKKTAVAAALLATAGVANAASVVKFGTVSTAEAVTAPAASLTVAAEPTAVASKKFTTAGTTALDGNAIAVTLPTTALSQNSLIKFTFANGGLDSADGYKLAFGEPDGDQATVPTAIFSQTVKNDTITELTLRLTDVAGLAQGDIVYLYNDTLTTDASAGSNFNVTAAAGLELKAMKGATHGSKVTVKVTADHVNAGVVDSIFDSNTLTLGTVLNGLTLNGFSTTTANVDFAADALKFIAGTNVTTSTVTASGLRVTEAKYTEANGKFTLATAGTSLTTAATLANYEYDLSVKADNCNALKVTTSPASTGLAISAGTIVKSTTADCTWTVDDVAAENSLTLTATVDGTTTLGANKFVASYDVNFDGTHDGAAKSQDDIYAGKSSTAIVWNTDVQANGTKTFPYLLAFNNNNAAFSFVKVDNTGNTKPLKLAMKGKLQTPLKADSAQVAFQNYYLMEVPAGQIGQFTGDDIIAALKTAKGKASDGFNDKNIDLDVADLFNMTVTLQAVTGSANGTMAKAKFSGVNTSSNGRTSVSVQ